MGQSQSTLDHHTHTHDDDDGTTAANNDDHAQRSSRRTVVEQQKNSKNTNDHDGEQPSSSLSPRLPKTQSTQSQQQSTQQQQRRRASYDGATGGHLRRRSSGGTTGGRRRASYDGATTGRGRRASNDEATGRCQRRRSSGGTTTGGGSQHRHRRPFGSFQGNSSTAAAAITDQRHNNEEEPPPGSGSTNPSSSRSSSPTRRSQRSNASGGGGSSFAIWRVLGRNYSSSSPTGGPDQHPPPETPASAAFASAMAPSQPDNASSSSSSPTRRSSSMIRRLVRGSARGAAGLLLLGSGGNRAGRRRNSGSSSSRGGSSRRDDDENRISGREEEEEEVRSVHREGSIRVAASSGEEKEPPSSTSSFAEQQQEELHHDSSSYDQQPTPLSALTMATTPEEEENDDTNTNDEYNTPRQHREDMNKFPDSPSTMIPLCTTASPVVTFATNNVDPRRRQQDEEEKTNDASAAPATAYYGFTTPSPPATPPPRRRRRDSGSTVSDFGEEEDEDENNMNIDFYPLVSRDYEWMGRSIESLLLGHTTRAPILVLGEDDWDHDADYDFYALRRRSTASTFAGNHNSSHHSYRYRHHHRRSSNGSFPGGRRGSLSLISVSSGGGGGGMQGGTMASYYLQRRRTQVPTDVDRSAPTIGGSTDASGHGVRRRSSIDNRPVYRRRSSMASSVPPPSPQPPTYNSTPSSSAAIDTNNNDEVDHEQQQQQRQQNKGGAGPNVLLNLLARESTGRSCFPRGIPETKRLRTMGGNSLYSNLDKPAAGMASEVAFLAAAIDTGDWAETHTIVSRLVVRLIGDPNMDGDRSRGSSPIDDPNLPANAHKYYAGGGRLGLERDAFVQAGGVQVLIRMFREKSFVGQEMAHSYDARDLGEGIVATRLAPCWNEALASLRELVYFIPSLVEDGTISDDGDFLPFLFTLLSHDSCFDGAAALIEEMLSFMSQTQQQQQQQQAAPQEEDDGSGSSAVGNNNESNSNAQESLPPVQTTPASTFFLGNVPNLYKLWRGFNCRQLAHFCRILALLVFEPEDRQLLESPAVLKSLELLQLRRNRAARAGRDSTVDMNQAILLGDDELMRRLLKLLGIMNYAPPLKRVTPYHVMAHFPFVADTLVMLGLGELESWEDIDRQERMARKLVEQERNEGSNGDSEVLLSNLGSVADMLEGLSDTLMNNNRQTNQIGHIIHVISAAQQAGVIVGRNRNRRSRRRRSRASVVDAASAEAAEVVADESESTETSSPPTRGNGGDVPPVDGNSIQGLASVAGILADQILVRRLYQSAGQEFDGNGDAGDQFGIAANLDISDARNEPRHLINTPEDAANSLQFNAMLLGPYQVEVLFVLCTLLGGRRKLDAQNILNRLGIVPVLDGMFQRLPWYKPPTQNVDEEEEQQHHHQAPPNLDDQPNGIHGPGCECTPESALCVQYLRMLHNFCDRDCDNYEGRRLLLSNEERRLIFEQCGNDLNNSENVVPGLLSKIIGAFIGESDESPYRFWLASCVESYLRGSSANEQLFVARSGLLDHLVEEISSDKLHCAGSLQTSFDLLGELGKGNAGVVRLLVNDLDKESFRKLMSVAAANLVDSNVFIRSLLLSLERLSAQEGLLPLYLDPALSNLPACAWVSPRGNNARSYLTHSWWDSPGVALSLDDCTEDTESENGDGERASDWFAPRDIVDMSTATVPDISIIPSGLVESVGHFGWVFAPVGDTLASNVFLPNTVERLSWFLAANQARLLRDLLGVVDLRNINHENICCLNTAVVVAIFAHRRKQLAVLLKELREMNEEEKESKRRAARNIAARQQHQHDDVVDRAFAQAMRYMDLSQRESMPYSRRASLTNSSPIGGSSQIQQIGDRTDVMRNFREVLWFWLEYYTHRGRDRLSLEFSSHIRFQEWSHVVSLLVADDGSSTSLVRTAPRLPRSPYQRAARVTGIPLRGE